MPSDHFVKIFDLADSGYRMWQVPAIGLFFVLIGIGLFYAPKYLEIKNGLNWRFKIFRWVFLGFSALWTGFASFGTYLDYAVESDLVRDGRCQAVEGPVENFLLTRGKVTKVTFTVSDVPFLYDSSRVTAAFNDVSAPIASGTYVRICYDPAQNNILRLEIRD